MYYALFFLFAVVGILGFIRSSIEFSTINDATIIAYFFGMIFFACGIFVCAGSGGAKVFGIFFLFSHGGIGYFLMMTGLLECYYRSPLITDLGGRSSFWLIVFQSLVLLAVLGFIIFNLSNKVKNKFKYPIIPLVLLLVATIIAVLFPYDIAAYLNNLF